jgi:hypothetical protein
MLKCFTRQHWQKLLKNEPKLVRRAMPATALLSLRYGAKV